MQAIVGIRNRSIRRYLVAAMALVLLALVLSGCGGGEAGAPSGSGSGSEDAPQRTAATTETGKVGEEVAVEGGSFTRVSPEELKTMMGSQSFPLVNVHIPFEGNIPGTDLSIPYNEIGQNLDRLPAKDEKIVLYCRSGSMSAEASRALVGLGYTNVWELGGGMIAWQEAGYRLTAV